MATQSLIIANTSPTVEVYRIIDGANTYILAQDGFSTNAPNTVSIQVDYSNFYDRIATALEKIADNVDPTIMGGYAQLIVSSIISIDDSMSSVNAQLIKVASAANTNTSYLNTMASHYEVERAINISDLKNDSFNDPGFDQFTAVSNEVKNPTTF